MTGRKRWNNGCVLGNRRITSATQILTTSKSGLGQHSARADVNVRFEEKLVNYYFRAVLVGALLHERLLMVTSEGSIYFIDEKCELSCVFLAFVTAHFQHQLLMLMLQQNKHSCATFRPCLHCRVLSRKGSLCQQNREGVDTAVPLLATKCQCRCCCSLDCQYWPPPVSYQCPL